LALAFTGLKAAVVAGLIEQDEESLYQELGARVRAMTVNPALGGTFDPGLPAIETLRPIDEIRSLGRRVFKHVSKETYQVACGDDPEYADERSKLEAAFALWKETATAALAVFLIGTVGVAAAVAAIVAAFLIKIGFNSVYKTTCEVWKEKVA
jgi:hypothetical protein